MEAAQAPFQDLHRYSAHQSASSASPYFASAYSAPSEAIDPSLQPPDDPNGPPLDDDGGSSIGGSPIDAHAGLDSNGYNFSPSLKAAPGIYS